MGRSMTAAAARDAFGDFATGVSPAGLEQYKLDRLLELRAVIDSLRSERGDELLDDVRLSLENRLP
jgi:hypothetical protein